MKLRISQEELASRSLFVATPMYGGMCFGFYVTALMKLNTIMTKNGLNMGYFSLFNESLVPRGRNTCVEEFLASGMTHLMFIDADIEFTPDDVLTLLVHADPKSDKDIVCGLYPKKHIRWDRIALAAKAGVPPNTLMQYEGSSVFNPAGLHGSYDLHSLVEITEGGTGFMIIQRRVFERFTKHYPELAMKIPTGWSSCFFDTYLDPEDGRYLSEDYYFCRLVRKMGMKVWVAPWLCLNHLGHYKFTGNPGVVSSLADIPTENEPAEISHEVMKGQKYG